MFHSWILSSLSKEIFPYVIGLSSSYEVWHALSQAFGSVSQNRQLQLHIELQELKKNDLSISAYLQRAKALADELNAAGCPLALAEFNAIIYRNIGNDYHAIITVLNLCSEPVSFHELHGQLIAHEILLKSSTDLPQSKHGDLLSNSAPLLPIHLRIIITRNLQLEWKSTPAVLAKSVVIETHTTDRCRRRYSRYNSHNQNATPHANYSSASHSQNNCASSQVVVATTLMELHVGNGQGLQITHTEQKIHHLVDTSLALLANANLPLRQTTFDDDFSGDEWLGFTFLGVMEARFSFKSLKITLNGQYLVRFLDSMDADYYSKVLFDSL
ncbi:hypothetical protein CK203_022746 [Vitis vinifera]|uniref:Retrovirus-related Pol polyprotein from transposon RE1 n=1 Tax=Vitis vinifera TaxID=29760 RepID=A0A438IWM9_VITVI|nr:hypothetical protein CK203_022746 [Vitis vinifera]